MTGSGRRIAAFQTLLFSTLVPLDPPPLHEVISVLITCVLFKFGLPLFRLLSTVTHTPSPPNNSDVVIVFPSRHPSLRGDPPPLFIYLSIRILGSNDHLSQRALKHQIHAHTQHTHFRYRHPLFLTSLDCPILWPVEQCGHPFVTKNSNQPSSIFVQPTLILRLNSVSMSPLL